MKNLIVIWVFCTCFFTYGQEVNKEFSRLLFNEQFDQADKNWSSTFNADNLFIAQNGYYELFRRSKKSGYYLFPNVSDEFSAFQVEASLTFIDHNNGKQSAGIIMMADKESGGGISVEINRKKEYRIVRVYKDKQVPINGNGSGWTKAGTAITKSENLITVKTYNRVYDLYVNGIFLESFTDIELSKGKIGIYVGPDSKVKFDYLKVLGEVKADVVNPDVNDPKGEEQAFTQVILKLKEQLNKKDKEIDDYRTRLKLCESNGGARIGNDTALVNERNRLRASLAQAEEENISLNDKLMSAEEELQKLRDFKAGVESGNDGDIVINLTNVVTKQKATIDELERKNKSLNAENNSLFVETKDLSKQLDKSTGELSVYKQENGVLKNENDSLKRLISALKDSLMKKQSDTSTLKGGAPQKELSDEEKLQQMIEKEREERRKRREEEEKKRREEEEKKNNGNG